MDDSDANLDSLPAEMEAALDNLKNLLFTLPSHLPEKDASTSSFARFLKKPFLLDGNEIERKGEEGALNALLEAASTSTPETCVLESFPSPSVV